MILTVIIESRWVDGTPTEFKFDTRSDNAKHQVGTTPEEVCSYYAGEYCDSGSVFVRNSHGKTLAKQVRGRLYS